MMKGLVKMMRDQVDLKDASADMLKVMKDQVAAMVAAMGRGDAIGDPRNELEEANADMQQEVNAALAGNVGDELEGDLDIDIEVEVENPMITLDDLAALKQAQAYLMMPGGQKEIEVDEVPGEEGSNLINIGPGAIAGERGQPRRFLMLDEAACMRMRLKIIEACDDLDDLCADLEEVNEALRFADDVQYDLIQKIS